MTLLRLQEITGNGCLNTGDSECRQGGGVTHRTNFLPKTQASLVENLNSSQILLPGLVLCPITDVKKR